MQTLFDVVTCHPDLTHSTRFLVLSLAGAAAPDQEALHSAVAVQLHKQDWFLVGAAMGEFLQAVEGERAVIAAAMLLAGLQAGLQGTKASE